MIVGSDHDTQESPAIKSTKRRPTTSKGRIQKSLESLGSKYFLCKFASLSNPSFAEAYPNKYESETRRLINCLSKPLQYEPHLMYDMEVFNGKMSSKKLRKSLKSYTHGKKLIVNPSKIKSRYMDIHSYREENIEKYFKTKKINNGSEACKFKVKKHKRRSKGVSVPNEYVEKVETQPFCNRIESNIKNEENKDLKD